MEKYELILKSKKEIVLEKKKQIKAYKTLLKDISEKSKVEKITQKIKKYATELKEMIEVSDEFGGYFLVDKKDNKKIKIDFNEKWDSCTVEEINSQYYHLIEVLYTDYNDNECICLYDFNGNLLVESCLEYEFVGKEIKVLQYGYMNYSHYDQRNENYWSILDADHVVGHESIEYDEDLKLYIVDENKFYSEKFEFIGLNREPPSRYKLSNLKFISEEGKCGVWYNGDYLLNPIYDTLFYTEINDFEVYYTTHDGIYGISIYLDNQLFYQNEFRATSIDLIDVNFDFVLLSLTGDNNKKFAHIDIKSSSVAFFFFNDIYIMETFYLAEPLFCGVNIESNQTIVFFNSTLNFPISEQERDANNQYITLEGIDVQKNIAEYFSSRNRFRRI